MNRLYGSWDEVNQAHGNLTLAKTPVPSLKITFRFEWVTIALLYFSKTTNNRKVFKTYPPTRRADLALALKRSCSCETNYPLTPFLWPMTNHNAPKHPTIKNLILLFNILPCFSTWYNPLKCYLKMKILTTKFFGGSHTTELW